MATIFGEWAWGDTIMDWPQCDKMLEMSDEELALEAANGGEHYFAALLVRFEKEINSRAARFHLSGLEKPDFVQEGMIGLLDAIRSYDSGRGTSFSGYALRCIDNRMLSLYRRSSGQNQKPLNSFVSLSMEEPDYVLRNLPQSTAVDPELVLLERERLETINKKIQESLSDMEHRVFTLYLRGASYTEIAESLGLTVKSVDNAIQRIRRKL